MVIGSFTVRVFAASLPIIHLQYGQVWLLSRPRQGGQGGKAARRQGTNGDNTMTSFRICKLRGRRDVRTGTMGVAGVMRSRLAYVLLRGPRQKARLKPRWGEISLGAPIHRV